MIDLHTHILPGWDDGARTLEEAEKMCAVAKADGIRKIALTPHFFRLTLHEDDPQALDEAFARFLPLGPGWGVEFFRGAEVFIQHDLDKDIQSRNLTLNGSTYLFVEFPQDHIFATVKEYFFKLMLEGYTPIISHPERNDVFAERPDLLFDLIRMGCLGQVTAKSLTGEFGHAIQKTAHSFLTHKLVHIIASDAHDVAHRPPRLAAAVAEAGKVIGVDEARAMVTEIPQAILDNSTIPDFGDPENPVRKKLNFSIRMPWKSRK